MINPNAPINICDLFPVHQSIRHLPCYNQRRALCLFKQRLAAASTHEAILEATSWPLFWLPDQQTNFSFYLIPQTFSVSYELLALICFPYLNSTHGTGIKATVTKPSKLVAHPMPSPLYICIVNSGNTAPNVYRSRPLAASAEAPFKAW